MKIKGVQQQWEVYNSSVFDGKLKPIVIKITRAEKYHGQFVFPDSHKSQVRPYICLSGSLNTEATWRDVLLHEMVHQYLYEVLGITEEEYNYHGPVFRSWAERLKLDMTYLEEGNVNANTSE